MTVRDIIKSIVAKGAAATVLDMEIRSGKDSGEFRFGSYDAEEFLAICFDCLVVDGPNEIYCSEKLKRISSFLEKCPNIIKDADAGRIKDMYQFYRDDMTCLEFGDVVFGILGQNSAEQA